MPKVVFINKLFAPQSFLNSVKQLTAQLRKIPLDELTILTKVKGVSYEYYDQKEPDIKEGALICGVKLEGGQ